MPDDPKHTVLVSLPVAHYGCLARMVANRILRNATDQTRVATLCREIICEYVDRMNESQCKGNDDVSAEDKERKDTRNGKGQTQNN